MSAAGEVLPVRRPMPGLVRLALTLYPACFRRRFGREIEETTLDIWIAARNVPPLARAWLAVRLLIDLLWGAVAEHGRGLLPAGEPGDGVRRSGPEAPRALDVLRTDVRVALRSLARHRGFAAAVVLTLGLGIGGVTAMWSVVHQVLLRPLPYPHADRLVRVWNDLSANGRTSHFTSSSAQYLAWTARPRTFEAMAAASFTTRTVEGGDYALRVSTGLVSPNFFEVLGAPAALGRTFRPGEERPDAPRVAMLGHELWRTEFGGDPGAVGRTIRVNGVPHEIVGVAAPGTRWLERPDRSLGDEDVQLWAARVLEPANYLNFLEVIVRLRPDATPLQLRRELGRSADSIAQIAWGDTARADVASHITAEPLHEALYGPVRDRLYLPAGAVLLVLLLACTNVAALLLSRLPRRRVELAMRAALGAARERLVRQLLTEAAVLALLAAVVSAVVAFWAVRAVAVLGPQEIPRLADVRVDGAALAVTLLTAVLCAAAVGVAPAWRGSRVDVAHDLGMSGARLAGPRRVRFQTAVLAGQFAVTLVLVAGAALMLRSFQRLTAVDPAIAREHVVAATVNLPAATYQEELGANPAGGSIVRFRPVWAQFLTRLEEGLAADPQVADAGVVLYGILGGFGQLPRFQPLGWDSTRVESQEGAGHLTMWVTPGFFPTLGVPLLEGRTLTFADRDDASRVAVVNRALATHFWPGESAIGKRFWGYDRRLESDTLAVEKVPLEIVGVVDDVRAGSYEAPPPPTVYLPLLAHARSPAPSYAMRGLQFQLLVRGRSGSAALVPRIRDVVRELEPAAPLSGVTTVDELVDRSLRVPRFYAFLLGSFGGFALLLAAAGVFGVLAQLVQQRRHEIGVRMALGARAASVVALVVRQAAVAALVGVALGLLAVLNAASLVADWLHEIAPTDSVSLGAAVGVLLVVAAAAAAIPARRAAQVAPMIALRSE